MSRSTAIVNGQSGVRSSSDAGLLTVHACIASRNGVDRIFVGTRSHVSASYASFNGDDGIAALGNGQVVENVTIGNLDRGITVLGGAATGDATAVGFNVTGSNSGLNLSGGTAIGCNVVGGAAICPP